MAHLTFAVIGKVISTRKKQLTIGVPLIVTY